MCRINLTDKQCEAFRRLPLSYNDMVRAIYKAGVDSVKNESNANDYCDGEVYSWPFFIKENDFQEKCRNNLFVEGVFDINNDGAKPIGYSFSYCELKIQSFMERVTSDAVSTNHIIEKCFGINNPMKADQMMVATVMNRIGYKKIRKSVGNVRDYVWVSATS